MTGFGPAASRSPGTPVAYEAYQPWSQQHNRRVLLPVLGLAALAVPGLIVLGFISTTIGGGAVLVGAMAAVLPVIPVAAAFLWVDRWEPEPSRLLFAAFLWGAGVSVLGAAIVNDTAAVLGEQVLGKGGGDLVGAVISAPIVEEAFKGAFLVGLLWLRRREFDGMVDGIVYAGLVAAGFAFTENILYFGRAFATDGLVGEGGSVVIVFMIRGVLSPFAHPVFTAMMGIAVGLAVRRRNPVGRVVLLLAGYLGAVALHALWNASAGLGFLPAFYAVIMVPLFGGLVVLVSGSAAGSSGWSPGSWRGSPARDGSRPARSRCWPAWPVGGVGARRCAVALESRPPRRCVTTRMRSPSSRSSPTACNAARSARRPDGGTTTRWLR